MEGPLVSAITHAYIVIILTILTVTTVNSTKDLCPVILREIRFM